MSTICLYHMVKFRSDPKKGNIVLVRPYRSQCTNVLILHASATSHAEIKMPSNSKGMRIQLGSLSHWTLDRALILTHEAERT